MSEEQLKELQELQKLQEYNFPYKEGIYRHDKEKNIFIQLTNRFKYT